MARQSELKRRYDPEIGRYVKKNIHTGEIHGEGLMDIIKSVGSKLFGKTAKEKQLQKQLQSSYKNRGASW